jgi:hypothetical protein
MVAGPLELTDVLDVIIAFAKRNGYNGAKSKYSLHDWLEHLKECIKQAIVRAWEGVPPDTQYLQSLFQSMPGRLQQCIGQGWRDCGLYLE